MSVEVGGLSVEGFLARRGGNGPEVLKINRLGVNHNDIKKKKKSEDVTFLIFLFLA